MAKQSRLHAVVAVGVVVVLSCGVARAETAHRAPTLHVFQVDSVTTGSTAAPQGAARRHLVAPLKPHTTTGEVVAWQQRFGNLLAQPEPGVRETILLGRGPLIVWFYSDATAAQTDHARHDLLGSGLFTGAAWAG